MLLGKSPLTHWSTWLGGAGTALFGFFYFLPQVALWVWSALPWWLTASMPQATGYVVTFVLLILAGVSKFIDQKQLTSWLFPKLKTVWQFFRDVGGNVRKTIAGGAAVLALSVGGVGFVMIEEGTKYVAYKDVVGVWTICVGHTGQVVIDGVDYGPVREGMKLTKAQCETLLKQDSEEARRILLTCVKRPLGQNQSDAMISFIINVGPNGCKSVVVQRINTGDFAGAADAFVNWSYAGGKPILRGRRLREAALFRKPDNDNFPWDTTTARLKALAKADAA